MNKKKIHHLLLGFTAFIFLLIAGRYIFTNSIAYLFLVWNLVLAYLPLVIAYYLSTKSKILHKKLHIIFFSITWLFFLPNSGYIITDFLHLGENQLMPIWFDIILLFSSGLLGLLMGVISIIWMQELGKKYFQSTMLHVLTISISLLCGFGIYLGRFLRWNTWDLLTHPYSIWQETIIRIIHPSQHLNTWGITLAFGALHLFCIYFLQFWKAENKIKSIV